MTKTKPQIVLTYDEKKDKTDVKTIGSVNATLMMDMISDADNYANKRLTKWMDTQREKSKLRRYDHE